jgi:hypothetical protein
VVKKSKRSKGFVAVGAEHAVSWVKNPLLAGGATLQHFSARHRERTKLTLSPWTLDVVRLGYS